jgi:ABC-type transport system involved in multi-copper enzyme maturation permease subunit
MLMVGCLVAIVVGLTIAAVHSTKPTAAESDQAQAQYEQSFARCLNGKYFGNGGRLPLGYESLEDFCLSNTGLYVESSMWIGDLRHVVEGAATFTILIGVILAASLGGADWSAGSMATLLTWEPRRILVLLARAIVVATLVFVFTLVIQLVLTGAFALAVSLRGTTGGHPPGLIEASARTMIRVSTMAAAIGIVALSLATLGRSTVASLGVLFGYLILFEGVIAGFSHGTQDKLLVRAAGVVVSRQPILGFHETISSSVGGISSGSNGAYILLGLGEAWVVVGFYVVSLLGLALLVFRARDVN